MSKEKNLRTRYSTIKARPLGLVFYYLRIPTMNIDKQLLGKEREYNIYCY